MCPLFHLASPAALSEVSANSGWVPSRPHTSMNPFAICLDSMVDPSPPRASREEGAILLCPKGFAELFFCCSSSPSLIFSCFVISRNPSCAIFAGPSLERGTVANVNPRRVGGYFALMAVDDHQSGWIHHPTEMDISAGIYR